MVDEELKAEEKWSAAGKNILLKYDTALYGRVCIVFDKEGRFEDSTVCNKIRW